MAPSIATSNAIVAECEVLNLTPPSKIATGICFLDHMVDQLTSHGQLGVILRCGIVGDGSAVTASGKRGAPDAPTAFFAPLRDYATGMAERTHDRDIFIAAGQALGQAMRKAATEALGSSSSSMANALFCCPLDEAFAEARIDLAPPATRAGRCDLQLAPYGKFAGAASNSGGTSGGRQWIGRYRTELTPLFWEGVASGLQADLSLRKVRGANAHHILEAAFKSFARAFRAALDKAQTGQPQGCAEPSEGPVPPAEAPAAPRTAERKRATKETSIEVRVDLDAPWLAADPPAGGAAAWTGKVLTASSLKGTVQPLSRVVTGIATLDEVFVELSKCAGIEMVVRCEGDRHIDDHHTAEDVAITLGQCLHEALGDKAGLARMACAYGQSGKAKVRAILDLSNRPHFESDLPLDEEFVGNADGGCELEAPAGGGGAGAAPMDAVCGGVLSCEMLFHVFDSLTLEMRSTCHLELIEEASPRQSGHTKDIAIAAARAYGAAVSRAIRVDPRRRGAVASSKGTLSK